MRVIDWALVLMACLTFGFNVLLWAHLIRLLDAVILCQQWILSHHNLLPDHQDAASKPTHSEWRLHNVASSRRN
jgi:hypothetical protein